jgi:hypothetical protein
MKELKSKESLSNYIDKIAHRIKCGGSRIDMNRHYLRLHLVITVVVAVAVVVVVVGILTSVKIDDISHLRAAPINNPIVAIEGFGAIQEALDSGLGRELRRLALKAVQFHSCTLGMECAFPSHHIGPSLLIDCIVDAYDGFHLRLDWRVSLPHHRIVEHLLGRVHPLALVPVSRWDG